MSEQFHQWLNNLTVWEEIDRFWNPSKYSCSGLWINDGLYQFFVSMCFLTVGLVVCTVVYGWYTKRRGKLDG